MDTHPESRREETKRTDSPDRFATVDERGRLILPEAVARRFGIAPGEQLYFDIAEHSIRLRRPLSNLARIYVEPTTRCNMDCEMCQRRIWSDGTGDMESEIFARILEGLEACPPRPTLVLGGFGEPLLHRRTLEFIEGCKELGAPVELISNGLLLTAERLQTLHRLKLDRLWLSVDGGSDRCGHVMAPEALAGLVQRVRHLNTIGHFPAADRLKLGLVFVAMRENIRQLPEVIDLARQLHADKLLISNLLPYTPQMSAEILYGRSIWNVDSGALQVGISRTDSSETIVDLLGRTIGYHDVLDILDREYAEPLNTCPFVKRGSLSVRWDGGVGPCPPLLHTHVAFKGDLQRRNRECLFGSLHEQGLLEIWNSPEYVEFRRRVTRFDFPPCVTCGTCELSERNEEDCFGNPFPTCGGCLWAQGFILCP